MSLHYVIKVSKDHAQVTATWDISVDISDTEMIANFALNVESKPLNTQCSSSSTMAAGNKACKGADFVTLSNPNQDCAVTFVITTNKPDVQDGEGVLRGDKTYGDVNFAG